MQNKISPIVYMICFLLSAACQLKSKDKDAQQRSRYPLEATDTIPHVAGIKMKDVLGINGFEWDFLSNGDIDPIKTNLIAPFGGFRHYLDWERIENEEEKYAFSPTLNGNWDYDAIYNWCRENDITVLACLKTVPGWFLEKHYPAALHDAENVPAPYASDRTVPASYLGFAKLGFQFAARYGSNKDIGKELVSVVAKPDWAPNQKKIGLNLISYIECNNEPNRWWKGEKAQQSPEEYAANMSAFYDGHKGALGPRVGVKAADPNMKVVMGGLAGPDVDFVLRMVEWCRQNRGYRDDGSVDLCFDIVNYHHYSNNQPDSDWSSRGKRGQAPEMSDSPEHARRFVLMAHKYLGDMEVWVTELGYDINPDSPQSGMAVGGKSILETQADWSIRSSLMYARNGVKRIHFYMLNDVDANSTTQYASSGFVGQNGHKRPALDYMLQVKQLMGDYVYTRTLNMNPAVDVYTLGEKTIYVLVLPGETGQEETYQLNLEGNGVKEVKVHRLQIDSDQMKSEKINIVNGQLTINVTETPVFVEVL